MKVTLAPTNNFIINKIYTAAHTCYSGEDPDIIFQRSLSMTKESMLKTIKHCLNSGHQSVVEHQSFMFFISGVSRALTHQLVRHRLASYSQQSQRYCKLKPEEQFKFVVPPSIEKSTALDEYMDFMEDCKRMYNYLIEAGIPAEDARYVLPNASCTNITVTMNLRQLMHFCNERMCLTAQWEIREMTRLMYNEITKVLGPELSKYIGPKCKALGYCPETKKRSCGAYKTRGEVLMENRDVQSELG